VSYWDARQPPEADAALSQEIDSIVEETEGTVVNREKVEIHGHPGLDIVIEHDDRLAFRARVYVVGRRLYRVWVAGSPRQVRSSFADAFFKSFQVLQQ
jgi:hypothetical protein